MLVAAPALAQEKPPKETTQTQQQTPPANQAPATADDAAPGTQGAGTVEEAPAATPAPATEAAQPTPTQPATPGQPAQPGTPLQPDAAPGGTSGAGTAVAQPAANGAQVAQAVGRDFGTYDKDANGALNDAEFGTWMSSLRKAAEPGFVPGSADANVWLGQAFASADVDRSKSVSQVELATFLTPKP
ncbi:MAG: calcium-binding protein [Sphingomonas sp.]|uniref:calcium-binding protein n=1 Tax=Sphingomonas sp. TaxID=28214 RepID=UPI0022735BB1|nr:calcium-binding protein [Sphingomonas sp.]MCX8475930.1 calcium-binding protein [Sphingomonas sp.]